MVGYSLGALVIFTALIELSKKKGKPSFGIVENVVLMGLPATIDPWVNWARLRAVIPGRIVNCYTTTDWLLPFLLRAAGSISPKDIAGLNPIDSVIGSTDDNNFKSLNIESVNVGDLIKGHLEYADNVEQVLKRINFCA